MYTGYKINQVYLLKYILMNARILSLIERPDKIYFFIRDF